VGTRSYGSCDDYDFYLTPALLLVLSDLVDGHRRLTTLSGGMTSGRPYPFTNIGAAVVTIKTPVANA
jgi:hypothetical protein